MIKKYGLIVAFIFALSTSKGTQGELFPDIPGWEKKLAERTYTPDDLWELINGAADIFLSYYFENLNYAEYIRGDEMIRVELYRHKTANDTYGIYSAERMPDYPQVKIGAQGYKSQGVLNYFAGNYYVKIMSAGVKETDEQTIGSIAQIVNSRLNQSTDMPEILNLFPEEGRIFLSDAYIAQNFLGYSFLRNAFIMKYEKPSEFEAFIINLPDFAGQIAEQYVQLVKKENVTETDGVMILKDQFNGTVFLKEFKGYLVGVINTEDFRTSKDLINKIVEKISEKS